MNENHKANYETPSIATIAKDALTNSMNYIEYRELAKKLHSEGKTTGPVQSESLLNYSVMNDHRMKRLDKTITLKEDLIKAVAGIKEKQNWILITELWCGDAAQNVPVINKIATQNSNIDLRLVLRDENPELMDRFLTNGGRSIPVLIVLNENFELLWRWGPRPEHAQNMLLNYKNSPEPRMSYQAFAESLHKWYADNKTEQTQYELMKLISN